MQERLRATLSDDVFYWLNSVGQIFNLIVYMLAFGIGPATIPWTLQGELVPPKVNRIYRVFDVSNYLIMTWIIFLQVPNTYNTTLTLGSPIGERSVSLYLHQYPLCDDPKLPIHGWSHDPFGHILPLLIHFIHDGHHRIDIPTRDQWKKLTRNFGLLSEKRLITVFTVFGNSHNGWI